MKRHIVMHITALIDIEMKVPVAESAANFVAKPVIRPRNRLPIRIATVFADIGITE